MDFLGITKTARSAAVTSALIVLGTVPASAQTYIDLDTFRRQGGEAVIGRSFDNNVAGFFDVVEGFTFGSLLGADQDAGTVFRNFSDEARSALDGVPIPSGSTSVSYTFDPDLDTFIRWERPLAPALSQNARTNGRNVLTIGASYSRLEFERYNSQNVERIVFPAATFGLVGPQGQPGTARDVLLATAELELDVYSFSVQFGVLDNLDIGVFIPVIDLDFDARAIDRFFIQRADLNGGRLTPANVVNGRLQAANGAPTFEQVDDIDQTGFADVNFPGVRHSENKLGIGDVVVRSKMYLTSAAGIDFGLALGVTAPTGDDQNLLGVDAWRFDPSLLVSSGGPTFSWHLNAGYHADAKNHERDRVDYSAGAEVRLHEKVTLLLDHVARLEIAGADQVRKFEIVPGIKANIIQDVVVGFGMIIPVNREGLTTKFTPTAAIDGSIVF